MIEQDRRDAAQKVYRTRFSRPNASSEHSQKSVDRVVQRWADGQSSNVYVDIAIDQRMRLTKAEALLCDLHALVMGECPRLLNEDSGGDANIACEIEAYLEGSKA